MIALVATTLPDHPLVQAVIIVGMLVKFPRLTALTHIPRRRAAPTRPSHARMPIPR
ncbi:hypothetical protein [Microbacterium sp. NPDC055683]